ncbi:MAG: hypothetical protein IT442_11985 [Phycisphaeraceae bacterium]|nr:hypothetical protein [Phycisphaeraceae bacterium]
MANRWLSRKFLLSLSAQVTSVLVLIWPQQESVIAQASTSVTALVVLLLSGLGYVRAEASVDRARAGQPEPRESQEPSEP